MRWPGKRNAALTLDYFSGMTYAQCAEKYGVHESRAHQVVGATLKCLDLVSQSGKFLHADLASGRITVQDVGLHLRRVMEMAHHRHDTPEAFYWEQERELQWRHLDY
jgi:hypothetical protein